MRSKVIKIVILGLSLAVLSSTFLAAQDETAIARLKKGVADRTITYKLTEPEEIKALLGQPQAEKQAPEGGMITLEMKYPRVLAVFGKFKNEETPFTLGFLLLDGAAQDIGRDRRIVLRNAADLKKMDRFTGLANVSLARLDLRDQGDFLRSMNFDNQTEWPALAKMPPGFDPGELLFAHMTPGLGVRRLQTRGITGKGVGVAIIDQPLLLGHEEYTGRIARYDATGLVGMEPQMHGSPIASILVGKNLGVAPEAALSYFAVPMWKGDNQVYADVLRKIFELNKTLPPEERIRVVSISTGMFSRQPHYEEWKAALAEADSLGILVVTCDPEFLHFSIASCAPGKSPDDPSSYGPSIYSGVTDVLSVPGANRTLASYRGDSVYTFDRDGGQSWGAPYIAGLAALGFQVAPGIAPRRLVDLMIKTTTKTEAGPLVNPEAFIAAVEKAAGK